MSDNQLMLDFAEKRHAPIPQPVLVTLSETDKKYHAFCIEHGNEFSESFLAECRCQRIACSLREFYAMTNYERARHLADESVVMRSANWATEPQVYIDYKTINERAKEAAKELSNDFAEWRQIRNTQRVSVLRRSAKAKGGDA